MEKRVFDIYYQLSPSSELRMGPTGLPCLGGVGLKSYLICQVNGPRAHKRFLLWKSLCVSDLDQQFSPI